MTIDHAQVSELLAPLVRGRLDEARRHEVEEHLATCTECGAELRALTAVVALEHAEPTPDERAMLRAAVAPRRAVVWGRFMPAFAAAALIALGVVAYGALGVADRTDQAGTSERADTEDEIAGADRARRADQRPGGAGAAQADAEDVSAATAAGGGAAQDDTIGDETGVARSAGVEASFQPAPGPRAFATTGLDHTLLGLGGDRLLFGDLVPRPWADQLEVCTRRLFAAQPMTLTLAYARAFAADDLLVAGFTWSEGPSDAPTHYAFWAWWRGGCDAVSPVFVRGTL